MYVVDYSAKSIALFGPSQNIKEVLKERFKAKFNNRLTDPSTNTNQVAGWIMKSSFKEELCKELRVQVRPHCPIATAIHNPENQEKTSSFAPNDELSDTIATTIHNPENQEKTSSFALNDEVSSLIDAPLSSGSKRKYDESVSSRSTPKGLYIIDYSEKGCAIFSDGEEFPDDFRGKLDDLGCSSTFAKAHQDPSDGTSRPAFLISKKRKTLVMSKLSISEVKPSKARQNPKISPILKKSKNNYNEKNDVAALKEVERLRKIIEEDSDKTASQENKLDFDDDSFELKQNIANIEQEAKSDVYFIDYSEKCVAIFGNTKPLKNFLKTNFAAKFNRNLTNPLSKDKEPGWILKQDQVQKLKDIGLQHRVASVSSNIAN
jgi:hypothetical protein